MGLIKKFKMIGTEVLSVLLSVDGEGSKLDSDMVDGKHYDDIIDDIQDNINNSISAINDNFVHKDLTETITGNKTFSGNVYVEQPTESKHAANKKYVDNTIIGAMEDSY